MTAITSGTAAESKRSVGTRPLMSVVVPIVAAVLVLVVVYTGWSAFARARFLLGWNDTFSGAGSFTVVACEPEQVVGPDRWRCQGRLTTGDAAGVDSDLVVGKDARLSSRPYVGQQIEVFYASATVADATGPSVVHARDTQLSELTRLYLALPPLLMILIGSAGSLLGLGIRKLNERSTNAGAWWRSSPLFLDLERRGATWLVVGVVTFVIYQLLVREVLGSSGLG